MASDKKRQRVWAPGVVWLSEDRELLIGPTVGYAGSGAAFRHSPLGQCARLRDLRHTMWLVERGDLTSEVISQQAIVLAETLLDVEHQPHARKWLAEQSLLCFSGAKFKRMAEAGLRVFRVAVEASGRLVIEARGGELPHIVFRASIAALEDAQKAALNNADGPRQRVLHPLPSVVDRVLRRLSRGALSEQGVVNALRACELMQPGYGYQGSTDGMAMTLEEVHHAARALDELFRQVDQHNEPMRREAAAVAAALSKAVPDAETVEVAIYGQAERFPEPEVAISIDEDMHYEVDGKMQHELVLPAMPRWFVTNVSMWVPRIPAQLAAALARSAERRPAPSQWFVALLVALLLLLALVSWWLR